MKAKTHIQTKEWINSDEYGYGSNAEAIIFGSVADVRWVNLFGLVYDDFMLSLRVGSKIIGDE